MAGDDNNEKRSEDPKFRFWRNNRGVNLSKRPKNRTGDGENGTSKLCPRRRGKFQSSKGCSAQSSHVTPLRSVGYGVQFIIVMNRVWRLSTTSR
jgi:hypothetical protein